MKNIIIAVLFAFGILLIGSDGNWFPWINLFGLVLFALAAIYSNRLYDSSSARLRGGNNGP